MTTTNALGETNKYPKTFHERDADTGKPITEPRNLYAMKGKTGANDEVYIGSDKRHFIKGMTEDKKDTYVAEHSYIATGDPYKPPDKFGRPMVKNGYEIIGGHEKNFTNAKTVTHNKKEN